MVEYRNLSTKFMSFLSLRSYRARLAYLLVVYNFNEYVSGCCSLFVHIAVVAFEFRKNFWFSGLNLFRQSYIHIAYVINFSFRRKN